MGIARAYPPPDMLSHFALEVGAPDFDDAVGGSVTITGNYRRYRRVYPQRLFATLDLPRKDFRERRPRVDWRAVKAALREWQRHYEETTALVGPAVPHLAYYDGGSFLQIEDRRSGELEIYLFEGVERDVYLAIDQVTTWKALRARLPHVPEERLRRELSEMVAAGLVFEEDDCFLALAMPGRRPERALGMMEAAAKAV